MTPSGALRWLVGSIKADDTHTDSRKAMLTALAGLGMMFKGCRD